MDDATGVVDGSFLAAILWPRRWLIAVCAIASAVLFGALGFILHPVYRATAVLVAASPDRNAGGSLSSALGAVGGLASLAGIGLSDNDLAVEESLAVLQSRQFTEAFIEDHNLMPVLFDKLWDPATKTWKVPPLKQPTPAKAYHYFDRIRTVKRDVKTGLITLQIDWRDRVEAATWANQLVAALNAEMRSRAIGESDASLGYLQKELAGTFDVGTRDSINRLIETQIRKRMLANVTQEYSLRFVDRALVADADDPQSPKKLVLIVLGLILGLLGGVTLALLLNARAPAVRRPV